LIEPAASDGPVGLVCQLCGPNELPSIAVDVGLRAAEKDDAISAVAVGTIWIFSAACKAGLD